MVGKHETKAPAAHLRRDQNYEERVDDPYQSRLKLAEPSVCPRCLAVYHRGHWTWAERPPQAQEHNCPACLRTAEHCPAGEIRLKGDFTLAHREELLQLVRHEEAQEKAEHPLERIMAIEDQDLVLTITTTGMHLARRIGKAIEKAYRGRLHVHQAEDARLCRVDWER